MPSVKHHGGEGLKEFGKIVARYQQLPSSGRQTHNEGCETVCTVAAMHCNNCASMQHECGYGE
jgi:hypothetical protein